MTDTIDRLSKLREPFPAHQISKLPKPTRQQTEEVKADYKKGIRCDLCGSWHHPNVVHLDYVGHAALTDRLLDTDPAWFWEPLAYREGLPAFDSTGGLWIKLTVCGVSRLGYGHAAAKTGIDPGVREKEVIGDALRNAAMRFGAALELWHKGDLHLPDDEEGKEPATPPWVTAAKAAIECLTTEAECNGWYKENLAMLKQQPQDERDDVLAKLKARKEALKPVPQTYAQAKAGRVAIQDAEPILDDEIPF